MQQAARCSTYSVSAQEAGIHMESMQNPSSNSHFNFQQTNIPKKNSLVWLKAGNTSIETPLKTVSVWPARVWAEIKLQLLHGPVPTCHQEGTLRNESPLCLSSHWDCFAYIFTDWDNIREGNSSDWPTEKENPVTRGLWIKLLTLRELVGKIISDLECLRRNSDTVSCTHQSGAWGVEQYYKLIFNPKSWNQEQWPQQGHQPTCM